MSTQTQNGKMLPRRTTPSAKLAQKKTKKTESKNTKGLDRITSLHKERNKLKYSAKSINNTTMQKTGSGIRVSHETRAFNENKLQEAEPMQEFHMLKLYHRESNDDSLSMISMNSRPSSAATDFPDEIRLKDDDEFESLENLSTSESERMSVVEKSQSDLAVEKILVDNGSPRIQITKLRDENNSINDKAEERNLNISNNPAIYTESVKTEEEQENKESKVKVAWELNEKFLLTTDFPDEVWEEKFKQKGLNTRRRSSDLLNASFPPLSTGPGLRRSSFPNSSNSLMMSISPRELPTLSGRQCKVQLPSNFPGIPLPQSQSTDSGSQSEDDEELDRLFGEKEKMTRKMDKNIQKDCLDVPGKKGKNVKNMSTKSSPISSPSQSPMASTETLAMKVASKEYLAARVVTQLNSAFKETITPAENDDDVVAIRESCVTPNLMPRRFSSLSIRPNTSGCLDVGTNSLILPAVHNEYSKSLPNLTDKTKRMFVTFDSRFPHASVVDLKGKSEMAQRCRLINRRLSSEDASVRAMLDKKVKKKTMVKKWVVSSAQCT